MTAEVMHVIAFFFATIVPFYIIPVIIHYSEKSFCCNISIKRIYRYFFHNNIPVLGAL